MLYHLAGREFLSNIKFFSSLALSLSLTHFYKDYFSTQACARVSVCPCIGLFVSHYTQFVHSSTYLLQVGVGNTKKCCHTRETDHEYGRNCISYQSGDRVLYVCMCEKERTRARVHPCMIIND